MDMKLLFRLFFASFVMAMTSISSHAENLAPLRVDIDETLHYPLNVFDKSHRLTGGLLKEFGDRMASYLGTTAQYFPLSRRRLESALLNGSVDLLCYTQPAWLEHAQEFQWSQPALLQIERVVVRQGSRVPENFPDDLSNRKIALQLGYHYASIQALFNGGQARRIDVTDVPSMFKLLERGGADAMISSEAEVQGYFKIHPEKRSRFVSSKTPYSIVTTECALSPASPWKIEQIDQALSQMRESGDIERMSKNFGLSER